MGSNQEVNVFVRLKDEFSKGMNGLTKSFKDNSAQFTKAGVGITAIGVAGAVAIKGWTDAANIQLKAENQLQAVLTSTKNAAGLTAEEIKNMASGLQEVTTIGDEAIITGQNMLLSFTSIGKDVFPQATETMLDMATAMNNGATPSAELLSSTAIQLGKAINDPIAGMAALGRVGVKFTDDQKDMIKTLQESGDIIGAQKIILDELSVEFGGRATAAAQTFEGQMIQMNNSMGDFKEELGMAVIPVLLVLVDALKFVAEKFLALPDPIKNFIAIGTLVVAVLGLVIGPILLLIGMLPAIAAGFTILSVSILPIVGSVLLVVAVIAVFVAALIWVWNNVDVIHALIRGAAQVMSDWVVEQWNKMNNGIKSIWDAIGSFVKNAWNSLKDFAVSVFTSISEFFMKIWNGILDFHISIWDAISAVFTGAIDMISNFITTAWEGIKTITMIVFDFIVGYFTGIWDGLNLLFNTSTDILKTVISSAWDFIKGVTKSVWDTISSGISNIWEGIKTVVSSGIEFIKGVFTGSKDAVVDGSGAIWTGIKDLALGAFDNIKEGVTGMVNWVITKLNKLISSANRVSSALSKVPGVSVGTISSIPQLADGGIVTRPTLAMIGEGGEPEAVIPLSKLGNMGGGGITVNVTGNTLLDDDAGARIGQMIVKELSFSTQF